MQERVRVALRGGRRFGCEKKVRWAPYIDFSCAQGMAAWFRVRRVGPHMLADGLTGRVTADGLGRAPRPHGATAVQRSLTKDTRSHMLATGTCHRADMAWCLHVHGCMCTDGLELTQGLNDGQGRQMARLLLRLVQSVQSGLRVLEVRLGQCGGLPAVKCTSGLLQLGSEDRGYSGVRG
jgi:hypothetical protein